MSGCLPRWRKFEPGYTEMIIFVTEGNFTVVVVVLVEVEIVVVVTVVGEL